eukprot:12719-Eustigmatos_ZCMA.PRE.1
MAVLHTLGFTHAHTATHGAPGSTYTRARADVRGPAAGVSGVGVDAGSICLGDVMEGHLEVIRGCVVAIGKRLQGA